ncbi:MAG TPA: hydroxymethylbilane synthase [Pirellulales bacterium]|nr:hydroxymethylbilane synthase [Pirellulales bacterium]
MTSNLRLRLGTRASPLARWQAQWVAERLAERGVETTLIPITTSGDERRTGPIGAIGGQGVFTKELERSLVEGEIDLAVHSLKDLPTDAVAGLVLAAVPARGPLADVLISRNHEPFDELPRGAAVGTGSLRRRTQMWHARPDLRMEDVRGNVETRIRKLQDGLFDALVLAEAGLERLGLMGEITQRLAPSLMLPAVGQGALGLEARANDQHTLALLATLDDADTHRAVAAERAMLAALRGGCLAPVGGWARMAEGQLHLSGVVLSADGARRVFAERAGSPDEPLALGEAVAAELFSQGAGELIEGARGGRVGLE